MRLAQRIAFLLVIVTTLPSCIVVDDFGVYWNRGIADPDVVGKWKRNDGFIIEFIEENGSLVTGNEKPTHFRTIEAVGYKFFLIREEDESGEMSSGGAVLLYKTDEKNFYRFMLNQDSEDLKKDIMNILDKAGFSKKGFTGNLGLEALDDDAFMAGVSFLKKPEHLRKIIHLRRVK